RMFLGCRLDVPDDEDDADDDQGEDAAAQASGASNAAGRTARAACRAASAWSCAPAVCWSAPVKRRACTGSRRERRAGARIAEPLLEVPSGLTEAGDSCAHAACPAAASLEAAGTDVTMRDLARCLVAGQHQWRLPRG